MGIGSGPPTARCRRGADARVDTLRLDGKLDDEVAFALDAMPSAPRVRSLGAAACGRPRASPMQSGQTPEARGVTAATRRY